MNALSANYTFLKVFNQDENDIVGQNLPVIPEKCIGGDQFPIIGRIELKTVQGFRVNDTFANLARRISIKIVNVSSTRYTVRFYPGNTHGQFIFLLFLRDDFSLDQDSAVARLYIDDIEVSTIR